MVKINRGYKSKNSNKTQKAVAGASSSSAMNLAPTKHEQAMITANRELQKLEEERVTYERLFKKTEEELMQFEYEEQQRIIRLDELREKSKNDPNLSATLADTQMQMAENQKMLMVQREERKEQLSKQRNIWMEREEEIYKTMRKETEDGQSI